MTGTDTVEGVVGAPSRTRAPIRRRRRPSSSDGVFLAVALLDALAVFFGEPQVTNNGDYKRTTSFLHVSIPLHQSSGLSLRFVAAPPVTHLPISLFPIVAWLLYEVLHGIGMRTFEMGVLVVVEYAVYWLGAYLASERLVTRRGRWTCACFAALFLVAGFYFRSFYEETMVLVLSPWLFYGLLRMARDARIATFAVVAGLVMLAKPEMVAFAPLLVVLACLYLPRSRAKVLKVALAALAMLAASGYVTIEASAAGLGDVNAYDRVELGLAYAAGGVGTWPATTSQGRASLVADHHVALPRGACTAIPSLATSLFGTPVEDALGVLDLAPHRIPTETSGAVALQSVYADGSWTHYAGYLASCPSLTARLVAGTFLVAIRSNYSLGYVRPHAFGGIAPVRSLAQAANWVLTWAGYLLAVALGSAIVAVRSWRRRVVLLAAALVVPLGVVAGDGFWEFERHLFPAIMLLPLAWFVASQEVANRRDVPALALHDGRAALRRRGPSDACGADTSSPSRSPVPRRRPARFRQPPFAGPDR